MKLLNNKYKLLEELCRNTYRAENVETDEEVIIYTYKAVDKSDWDSGKLINEELRKLKLNNKIIDFFYRDDINLNKKIFYKVTLTDLQKEINKENSSNNSNEPEVKSSYSTEVRPKKMRKSLILVPVCGECNTPLNLRQMDPSRNKAYCKKCHRDRTILMKEPEISIKEGLKKPANIVIEKTKKKFLIKLPAHRGLLFFLIPMIPILYLILSKLSHVTTLQYFITLTIGTLFITILSGVRKYIEIKDNYITIGTKPFNFKKPKKFNINKVEQLYVKKMGKIEFQSDTNYKDSNNYFENYMLKIILTNNEHYIMLKTRNPKLASYLEYQIEEYLKIQDKVVPYEYNIDNDLAFFGEE